MALRRLYVVFEIFVWLIHFFWALLLFPYFVYWLGSKTGVRCAQECGTAIYHLLASKGEMRRSDLLDSLCDQFEEKYSLFTAPTASYTLDFLEKRGGVETFSKPADETDMKNGAKPDSTISWCRLSHERPQRDDVRASFRDMWNSLVPEFAPQTA